MLRFIRAAREGNIVPPADMRYLKGVREPGRKRTDTSRDRIISFLKGIYDSVAETLPDVKDEACDFDAESLVVEMPELADPYAKALNTPTVVPLAKKKQKIRRNRMSINLEPSRKHAHEERWLPPGHMRDYWEQMKYANANGPPVAFSTFWRVWHSEFPFMRFRPTSSHAQCGVCLKHKLLIKSFSGHIRARSQQVELYARHLRAQYEDRLKYYELRGSSRTRTPFECTIILDGMDQGKFMYPRHPLFASKDLSTFVRPRAHIAAGLCHGRCLVFTISSADVRKDANASIETTAFCLTLISKQTDLRQMTVNVQADNTTREVKNNPYLRWLASLVSHGEQLAW